MRVEAVAKYLIESAECSGLKRKQLWRKAWALTNNSKKATQAVDMALSFIKREKEYEPEAPPENNCVYRYEDCDSPLDHAGRCAHCGVDRSAYKVGIEPWKVKDDVAYFKRGISYGKDVCLTRRFMEVTGCKGTELAALLSMSKQLLHSYTSDRLLEVLTSHQIGMMAETLDEYIYMAQELKGDLCFMTKQKN